MSRSTMIRMTIVIWGFLSLVGGCADKHVKLSYLGDTELTHYQDFERRSITRMSSRSLLMSS